MSRSTIVAIVWTVGVAAQITHGAPPDWLLPLDASPYAAIADVEAVLQARAGVVQIQLTASRRAPEKRTLVGALQRREDGGYSFSPLRQHHGAVEHWFVRGVPDGRVRRGNRVIVRLRGVQRLLALYSFGASCERLDDQYGRGMAHVARRGTKDEPAEAYHERIYGFDVEAVVATHDVKSYERIAQAWNDAGATIDAQVAAGDWKDAIESVHQRDEWARVCDQERTALPARRCLRLAQLVEAGPSTWYRRDYRELPGRIAEWKSWPIGWRSTVLSFLAPRVAGWDAQLRRATAERLLEHPEETSRTRGLVTALGYGKQLAAKREQAREAARQIARRLQKRLDTFQLAEAWIELDRLTRIPSQFRGRALRDAALLRFRATLSFCRAAEEGARNGRALNQIFDGAINNGAVISRVFSIRVEDFMRQRVLPLLTADQRQRVATHLLAIAREAGEARRIGRLQHGLLLLVPFRSEETSVLVSVLRKQLSASERKTLESVLVRLTWEVK